MSTNGKFHYLLMVNAKCSLCSLSRRLCFRVNLFVFVVISTIMNPYLLFYVGMACSRKEQNKFGGKHGSYSGCKKNLNFFKSPYFNDFHRDHAV